jgi:hypothetical protein
MPIATLVFFLSLSGLASAQVAPTLTMSAQPATFALDPGQTGTSTVTLQNGGNVAGTATVTLAGSAAGWNATVEPSSVAVPSGGSATVTVTVRAPAVRNGSAQAFPLTVAGTLTDNTPLGQTATDEATIQSTLTAAPPPPPPPAEFPWIPVVGVTLLVAIAAAFFAMQYRRESGVEIFAQVAEKEVRPGYETYVPLEVRNTSGRPRIAELGTAGAPLGWAVGVNLTRVPHEAGEVQSLWLAVRPPVDAPGGITNLVVTARPMEARKARQPATVAVRVVPDSDNTNPAPGTLLSQPVHQRSDALYKVDQ